MLMPVLPQTINTSRFGKPLFVVDSEKCATTATENQWAFEKNQVNQVTVW